MKINCSATARLKMTHFIMYVSIFINIFCAKKSFCTYSGTKYDKFDNAEIDEGNFSQILKINDVQQMKIDGPNSFRIISKYINIHYGQSPIEPVNKVQINYFNIIENLNESLGISQSTANKNYSFENRIRVKKSADPIFETDFDEFLTCKLTPNAIDYIGTISVSKSSTSTEHKIIRGDECLYWNSPQLSKIINAGSFNFPDGSVQGAKKYCRNPDNSTEPWCFNSKLERKTCDVRYCLSTVCRISGPGVEYQGKMDRSVYDNVCKLWTATDIPNNMVGLSFPEGHPSKASNFCRNPTNDPAGPYCFVDIIEKVTESTGPNIKKEYCDVPLCDLYDTGTYLPDDTPRMEDFDVQRLSLVSGIPQDDFYTHFTSFQTEELQIKFDLRLWSPEDLHNGIIRIAISSLPVPVTSKNLDKWNIGFEIIISMYKSGVTSETNGDKNWEKTPKILVGTHWTNLTLEWKYGFISLKHRRMDKAEETPIFSYDFMPEEDSIFGQPNSTKFFYSILGSPIFFIPRNTEDPSEFCEQHITTSEAYVRFFPLLLEDVTKSIDFYLKSSGNCSMWFFMTPVQSNLLEIKLVFHGNGENSYLSLKQTKGPEKIKLFTSQNLLSYDSWAHFSIKIVKGRFQLFVDKDDGFQILLDEINFHFNTLQWFSVGSNTISHWSFMCDPKETVSKEIGSNEECTVSSTGKGYRGHIWRTKSGHACLPWIAKYSKSEEEKFETDDSVTAALNYCRNVDNDSNGAFCYIYNIHQGMKFEKDYCDIPKCVDCRKAGIGSDYDGLLNTTISKRICQAWDSNKPHKIPNSIKDNDLFPEKNIKLAQNFCRVPNSDIAGPWCYTTDPDFPFEPCNVVDCNRPKDCTIILKRPSEKIMLIGPYLRQNGFPFWLKVWNPVKHAGLILKLLKSIDSPQFFEVVIGVKENSGVSMYYSNNSQKKITLESKNLERIIRVGRWTGFKLIMKHGLIKLFLEDVPDAILSWVHVNESEIIPFQPYYIQYSLTKKGGPLGLSVLSKDCYPEVNIKNKNPDVYYPLSIWKRESFLPEKGITYYFRGNGSFSIKFYILPEMDFDMKIDLNKGNFNEEIVINQKINNKIETLGKYSTEGGKSVISENSWTNISISLSEEGGQLFRDTFSVIEWTNSKPKNYYYFTVEGSDVLLWIANCIYPDLDSPGMEGGWSDWGPWTCSRPCGGGLGTRHRTCTKPIPSFFGELCPGEDRITGECNTFECGLISPQTLMVMEERLKKYAFNLKLKEHENASIPCYKDVLEKIKEESPKSKIYWYKNEKELHHKVINDIDPKNFYWKLSDVNIRDTGTYFCAVRMENFVKVIQVTAVVITANHTTKISRAGKNLDLDCLSLQFASIYDNLLQRVYFNNILWRENILAQRTDASHHELLSLSTNYSGIWECEVIQEELNASWTTNWIKLKVLPKSSFIQFIFEKEDQASEKAFNPNIGLFIFTGIMIVLTLIGIIILLSVWFIKYPKHYLAIPTNAESNDESQHN